MRTFKKYWNTLKRWYTARRLDVCHIHGTSSNPAKGRCL